MKLPYEGVAFGNGDHMDSSGNILAVNSLINSSDDKSVFLNSMENLLISLALKGPGYVASIVCSWVPALFTRANGRDVPISPTLVVLVRVLPCLKRTKPDASKAPPPPAPNADDVIVING